MNALVSILLVSYNSEKFIGKTIKSCLEQTYQNIELLILDNNSSDGTINVIKSFNDSRIHFFAGNRNLGPYEGLNYLIDRANGSFIAIQDHDDIWFPEKIEKQVVFLHANQDFIACGVNTYVYFESREVFILIENPFLSNHPNGTSLVFRSGGFRYNTGYLLSDEHFEKHVLSKFGKIARLQDSLCIHRIRADSMNLSTYRFSLSRKNIREFFMINGLSVYSINYFLYLIGNIILPDSLMWHIRKHITLRNREWISMNTFKKRYPNILF